MESMVELKKKFRKVLMRLICYLGVFEGLRIEFYSDFSQTKRFITINGLEK